ncbi:Fic family protein [Ancylobacter oerskovii]|nr:Fic family protein [Ancylobacter oerskovii]
MNRLRSWRGRSVTDTDGPAQRHSRANEAELITDPILKAEAEALNGLRQFDAGRAMIHAALDRGSFKLRLSHVLGLQREALAGISSYAGNFRPAGVAIEGSKHEPPGAHLVPELVEELCDYVNESWTEKSAIHLAAYIMWRLNWIHPFADGNGRTSRITSYVVLCIKLGADLPGLPTIPDQITYNRKPYFDALDAADAAWRDGHLDLTKMEELLSGMLAKQLHGAYEQAGGVPPDSTE